MPLVETATVAAGGAAVAQAIASILPLINGARSVVLEIDNNTNTTLTRVRDHHDHGGFAVTPSSNIPHRYAGVFGAQSSGGGLFTGTEGNIVYNIGGLGELTISWVNPFIGGNESSGVVSGLQPTKFRVVTTTGAGNTAAHMRFELFDGAKTTKYLCGHAACC